MKQIAMALVLVVTFIAGCTSNADRDSDGDGLTDREELRGWTITVETMTETFTRHVTSDPHNPDTDGDGVSDLFEATFGLDPRSQDTDQDGLSDCQEIMHTNRTECEDPDFEGPTDGGYGTVANLADSDASSSIYVNSRRDGEFAHRLRDASGLITRGDGISDGDEVNGYRITLPDGRTRLVRTDPLVVDSDQDGLEDGEERYLYGTDPTVADTDGDGCEDGFDMVPTAAEKYKIDLHSLTWFEGGRSGTTDVIFHLSIVDRGLRGPLEGVHTIQHGQENDISGLSPSAVTVLSCSYPAREPWFRIDLQVAESEDGQYMGPIDVHSETLPSGVSVWMHARTGEYRWDFEQPGGPPPGQLVWRGSEGEVTFQPRVVLP